MPGLGMTLEKGKIISWNVNEGEFLQKENLLLTVETDKVSYEILAPQTGYLNIRINGYRLPLSPGRFQMEPD